MARPVPDIMAELNDRQSRFNPVERKPGPPNHWSYYLDPKDSFYIESGRRMAELVGISQWDSV